MLTELLSAFVEREILEKKERERKRERRTERQRDMDRDRQVLRENKEAEDRRETNLNLRYGIDNVILLGLQIIIMPAGVSANACSKPLRHGLSAL